jgi:protein-L-isoaspartate(D-aspartate) O-methyltransferase
MALLRRVYARQVLFAAGVENAALEDAYASVRREDFVGPGPWPIFFWRAYRQTPTADPIYLYSDVLVGLRPERQLNNGQPSAHAIWIAGAGPRPGDHVVHIGAGSGYYTALMAHMVGPGGRVSAIEFDPDLAAWAAANLATQPHVRVQAGDGATVPLPPADVIYVNAGTTAPAETWLDALKDGGRLVLPLTTDRNFGTFAPVGTPSGGMFRIERQKDAYRAKWISAVGIIPAESMRDPETEAALAAAFAKGGWDRVSELVRTDDPPTDRCWVKGRGWALLQA